MLIKMNKLVRDSRGASLIEYVLLVGVIAIIALAGFKMFGGNINKKIQEQAGTVNGIQGTAP